MADRSKPTFQRRDLPAELGVALRTAREGAGRVRRDVAARAGIAARTLARIERGTQSPTQPTLERLCGELGVSTFAVVRRWVSQALDLPEDPSSAPELGMRALRRRRGMTLAKVAAAAGVSAPTLSRFERGITASRLLGRRVGGPEVAFNDRGVALDSRRRCSVPRTRAPSNAPAQPPTQRRVRDDGPDHLTRTRKGAVAGQSAGRNLSSDHARSPILARVLPSIGDHLPRRGHPEHEQPTGASR